MKIPVPLKLAALAVGSTVFYGYVGQLVPQKEVHPPQVVEIATDVTSAEMAEIGRSIFEGKGICATCHNGSARFPDLAGVATRAAGRLPGYTDVDYFAESLYEPDKYIVPGFSPGMPAINKPPIGLTDEEILTVIAYLQSLGGSPTVTMETKVVYTGGTLGGSGEPGGQAAPEDETLAAAVLATGATDEAEPEPAVVPAAVQVTTQFERSGCTDCHYVDRPGTYRGPSLYDAGARLSSREILRRTVSHEPPLAGAATELTLAELRKLADAISQMKGPV